MKVIGNDEFLHVKPQDLAKRNRLRRELDASFEELLTHDHVSALKHFNESFDASQNASSPTQASNGRYSNFNLSSLHFPISQI